ncbi:MAG: hypothetical protein U9N14_05145, partial [Pseudomonadota bacterium]|nr:hypothetical protein [Pseudomonadota bacterium]
MYTSRLCKILSGGDIRTQSKKGPGRDALAVLIAGILSVGAIIGYAGLSDPGPNPPPARRWPAALRGQPRPLLPLLLPLRRAADLPHHLHLVRQG